MPKIPGGKQTTRYAVAPGAKLTLDEIKRELLKHGMHRDTVDGLETHLADYAGHLKCANCGAYHWNHGSLLARCMDCGWCRHASVTSGPDGKFCDDCGAQDPQHVELGPEHHEIHFLDESGKVVRKARH